MNEDETSSQQAPQTPGFRAFLASPMQPSMHPSPMSDDFNNLRIQIMSSNPSESRIEAPENFLYAHDLPSLHLNNHSSSDSFFGGQSDNLDINNVDISPRRNKSKTVMSHIDKKAPQLQVQEKLAPKVEILEQIKESFKKVLHSEPIVVPKAEEQLPPPEHEVEQKSSTIDEPAIIFNEPAHIVEESAPIEGEQMKPLEVIAPLEKQVEPPLEQYVEPPHQVYDPETGDFTIEEKIRRLKQKLSEKIPDPSPNQQQQQEEPVDFNDYRNDTQEEPVQDNYAKEDDDDQIRLQQQLLRVRTPEQSETRTQMSNPQQPTPIKRRVQQAPKTQRQSPMKQHQQSKPLLSKKMKNILDNNGHMANPKSIQKTVRNMVQQQQPVPLPRPQVYLPPLDVTDYNPTPVRQTDSKLEGRISKISDSISNRSPQQSFRSNYSSSNQQVVMPAIMGRKPLISVRVEDAQIMEKRVYDKEMAEVDEILRRAEETLQKMHYNSDSGSGNTVATGKQLRSKSTLKPVSDVGTFIKGALVERENLRQKQLKAYKQGGPSKLPSPVRYKQVLMSLKQKKIVPKVQKYSKLDLVFGWAN